MQQLLQAFGGRKEGTIEKAGGLKKKTVRLERPGEGTYEHKKVSRRNVDVQQGVKIFWAKARTGDGCKEYQEIGRKATLMQRGRSAEGVGHPNG